MTVMHTEAERLMIREALGAPHGGRDGLFEDWRRARSFPPSGRREADGGPDVRAGLLAWAL